MQASDQEQEKQLIIKEYRNLLKACRPTMEKGDKRQIREAFNLALEAHRGMRRKSGELYIFHPLQVATICAREIGLGTTSIICALLHDVVEDTDTTLEEIEAKFGHKAANIIDGLTKISGMVGKSSSIQAENFRKILLTLADDVRVILIKLADRLHNMRTLDSVPRTSQLKIASETLVLFAPLAHRLGLYSIKGELEDLSLKYTEPLVYKDIASKLVQTRIQRQKFMRKFVIPIEDGLKAQGISFDIKGRPKSIFSIYNKMKKQNIPFEEVFDLFAIRIIIDTDIEVEKADCWRVYSLVTDHYKPNPERLRDWISVPKSNGYESLHTTVMGPQGRWVEVQIRSRRMDEIAERGYAAHWKYKDTSSSDHMLEEWLKKIRELLENPESNAVDFLDDFKLNFFAEEVYVFTPKGDLHTLPANSTALDFAFEIHTQVGVHCLGAKVNHRLVPLSYKLKNGDQVEIITSKKQKPTEDWLNYVVTAKAKSKIKTTLKEEKRRVGQDGKEVLMRKFRQTHLVWSTQNVKRLAAYFKLATPTELYWAIGSGKVEKDALLKALRFFEQTDQLSQRTSTQAKKQESVGTDGKFQKPDMVIVGENLDLDYSFARCCNPIPGDDIFGFITIGDGIKIHRTNCPNGIRLMSNFGYRIIRAKWAMSRLQEMKTFPAGIRIIGIDSIGIVSRITDIISKELKVNIQSLSINAIAGAFEGRIILQIFDTEHLDQLITKLKSIQGIDQVARFTVEESLPAPVTPEPEEDVINLEKAAV